MFIREFIEKNKIKLEGSWEKYDQDFRKAINEINDLTELRLFIKTNKKSMLQYKEANEKGWAQLMADIWDKAFGKWPAGHSTWAIPESQTDVDYVLGLLRNGLLVEDAGNKLYNVMGYSELFEAIEAMRQELPRTNFADTLANFIVKLEPKTPAIKNMQDAIIHDTELSTLIMPPVQVKEGKENPLDTFAKALHEDLKFIKSLDRWTLEEANKKLVMRSMQTGRPTIELKNHYMFMFEDEALLGVDNRAYKAAMDLNKKFKELKKLNKDVSPETFTHLLYKTALLHHVPTADIEAKVREIFSKPKTSVREPAKTDWKIRHFTKEAQVLDFAKKKQTEPNLPHLIDLCATVLPSGSEPKWRTYLNSAYGEQFATWFIGLMHYADDSGPRQTVGQNEREVYDYLKRNAEHDAKYIAIAKQHIQDIVTHAKAIGTEHGQQVLSQMKEATLSEEPKVFGRKKPEITIRKKPQGEENRKEDPKDIPLGRASWVGQLDQLAKDEEEANRRKFWADTDIRKKHNDRIQQTGKHDFYQDRDIASNYTWTAADAKGPEVCPNCDGSGETPGRPDSKCISCRGKGIIESYDMSSISESILMVLRRLPEDEHWLTIVEEVAGSDIVKKKALTSALIKMGLVETVIDFKRPKAKFSKPNHLAYMASWAKQYIENEIKVGHVKNAHEAFDLAHSIHDRLSMDMNIETSDEYESLMIKFDKEFEKMYGKTLSEFIDDKYKKHMSKVEEAQVLAFKAPEKKVELSVLGKEKNLTDFCKKVKEYVDGHDLSTKEGKDDMLAKVEAGLAALKIRFHDFLPEFEQIVGEDFYIYYLTKASEDRGVLESTESNQLFLLTESLRGETAHRVRVELAKIIRGFVDSSDISLLSNFESYEDKEHISLKMNVYQDTVKNLDNVITKVKEEMLDHGYTQSKGPNMFIKGNIIVKLLPIRKTFRSGPYKNRETPTWGIEVIGPKKGIKKETPVEK